MHILMLNNEFPPLGGGTGTVNQAILQRLSEKTGLEIDLITSALGDRSEEEVFADKVKIFKVPVNNRNIHHSSNRELLTYAIRAFGAAVRLHQKRRYDICLAWSTVPAGGVAKLLSRTRGLPYTVRLSGPDIPGFEERYRRIYPILTPVIRSIWHGAKVVIAKCESEAKMVESIDSRVKLIIIPNGVDTAFFCQRSLIPDDGPLCLLCVARLIERKGQLHLIEAMRRLMEEGIDVRLSLVGLGDAQEVYQSKVKTAGIADRVRFAGYVPREEIRKEYTAAHVFVLPSKNEGMSVATLEAISTGLPIVITRTGGTGELVIPEVNGLTYEWGDVETLTSHLRRLAMNRDLVRRMGAASRERATRFSWDEAAKSYLELFDDIIS